MHKLLILIALLPASALAGPCTFTTECFETEACTETEFTLNIESASEDTDNARITSDAETISGTIAMPAADGILFQGSNAAGAHLLTAAPDGAARYSVQYFEGPMVITYHGTCEEAR